LRNNGIAVAGAATAAIISFILLISTVNEIRNKYFTVQSSTGGQIVTNGSDNANVVANEEMSNTEGNTTESDIQNDSQLENYLSPLWNSIY
jgi:hypothetical protein